MLESDTRISALVPEGKLWFGSYKSFVIFSGAVHKGPQRCKHCFSLLLKWLMAWLVPLLLSLLLTHTPPPLSLWIETLALEIDCLLWWNDAGRLNFLFYLADWMGPLVYPSVPLESAVPGGALLRVAAVGAGVWTLREMQHQSYFCGDLKENRQIIHILKKRKEKHHRIGKDS